jgi:hypothetical protein
MAKANSTLCGSIQALHGLYWPITGELLSVLLIEVWWGIFFCGLQLLSHRIACSESSVFLALWRAYQIRGHDNENKVMWHMALQNVDTR